MENKKQSIILLIISVLVLLVIIGGAVYSLFFSKNFMKRFNNQLNSNKSALIYYKRTGCMYCEKQAPILEALAKDYGFKYMEIDIYDITAADNEKVKEKLGISGGTPTFAIVKKGEVVSKVESYMDRSVLFDFLQEGGIISEDVAYTGYETVNYSKYKELTQSEEPVVITAGQIGCTHCDAIKPALNAVAKNDNVAIYYLDLATIAEEDSNDFFVGLREMGYGDPDFLENGSFGTPTTFIFQDGKIKYSIGGEMAYSKLKNVLKKQKIIE